MTQQARSAQKEPVQQQSNMPDRPAGTQANALPAGLANLSPGQQQGAMRQVAPGLRQALAQEIGQRHGNAYLQRFLADVAHLNQQPDRLARSEEPAAATVDFDPEEIVSEDTASQIATILNQSQYLAPYIQEKLTDKPIGAAGKFIIHETEEQFNEAFTVLHGHDDKRGTAPFEARLKKIKGFYHRLTDTIHLKPTSEGSHALHEAIHRYAEPRFRGIVGRFIDEGVTQFFADKVMAEMKLPAGDAHGYGPELKFAQDFVPFLGEAYALTNFFQECDADALLAKLGTNMTEFNEKYRFGEDARDRFLRHIKRLVRQGAPPPP